MSTNRGRDMDVGAEAVPRLEILAPEAAVGV
jgi:hypothetical protein